MKAPIFLLLVIAAFLTAGAFKSVITPTYKKKASASVAQQKLFTINCSPLYIPAEGDDIPPLEGWGNYTWKITTRSDSAQFYFNQGINMYYGFHIIEARASFDKATRFDEDCAMAWYGKALAFGPNINDYVYERPSEAYPSAQKANSLKGNCTPIEKALIEAITVRYSDDSTRDQGQLNNLYKDAMKVVYDQFNNDENVSTLYADALMLLHPWDLYNHDLSPKAWTPGIVAVIHHALQLNPKQPGANHLFIHAVEASANPGQALASANFLSNAMPDVAHVTHMPSHIYIRTGFYAKGITGNQKALAAYQNYLKAFPPTEENVGLYALHNYHMELNCAQMAGNYKKAVEASNHLRSGIPSFYLQVPGPLGNYVQYVYQSLLFTYIRFGKWQEILNEPLEDSLTYSPVLLHFARGIAFAKTGKIAQAKEALHTMNTKMETTPALKIPYTPFNSAYDAALVGRNILMGVIEEQQHHTDAAILAFKNAVEAEDALIYDEPRDWLLPARQYLGNALLNAGKYDSAIAVFQRDLEINPNNGWSLTGLATAYRKLKKSSLLAITQKRMEAAWVIKDTPITSTVF